MNNTHQQFGPMSKLIAPQLRPFRTVGWYCHLFHNTSTEAASPARRRHFSNYKAESEALMMVISLAVDSHQKRTMAVFLTVALSVLQAQQQIATSNNSTARHSAKTAEWSFSRYPPSVEFLEMNKQTLFAKQCAQTEQLYSNVSYQEKATITTALMMPSQEINT